MSKPKLVVSGKAVKTSLKKALKEVAKEAEEFASQLSK